MKLLEVAAGQCARHWWWFSAQLSPHDARRNTATQSGILSHGLWVTITTKHAHTDRQIDRWTGYQYQVSTHFRQGDDGSIGPIGSTRMPDAVTHHTCIKSSTEYELGLILKEIRFITDQVSASFPPLLLDVTSTRRSPCSDMVFYSQDEYYSKENVCTCKK